MVKFFFNFVPSFLKKISFKMCLFFNIIFDLTLFITERMYSCGLPKDTGNGTIRLYSSLKYYYDPEEMKCHNFDYSGYEGNNNNFDTYNECTMHCRGYNR